jgi:peptide/nickel transport system permease protein
MTDLRDSHRAADNGDPADAPLIREEGGQSLTALALERFRHHGLAKFGISVLVVVAALVILAPIVSWHSPTDINLTARGMGPSWSHPFGTDRTGRDIYARVLFGGRISLIVATITVAMSAVIGTTVGSLAGFYGRTVDTLLMRLTDLVLTFPRLVIVIALVAVLGPGVESTVLTLGLLSWPQIARIVRGEFLHLREEEFVLAAENCGAPSRVIILRHLLPNVVGPVTVALTLLMADAILLEAALSFLGLGVQIPSPSWGNMLQDAQSVNVLENIPWMWFFPGTFIVITVLSINFVGDGLRDAFDPKSQHG